MTEDRFAMVSEWMVYGNINQFVTTHRDTNRFDLVSSPPKLLRYPFGLDDLVAPVVRWRRKGPDLHARSRDDPW